MKLARIFAYVSGALGSVLMAGAVVFCLLSLDAPVKMVKYPQEAMDRAEKLLDCIEAGDYAGASEVLYGQPNLGVDREPGDEVGKMVWSAFLDSLSCETKGKCYASDKGLACDAVVTGLDITTVMETLTERTHTLLTQRIEQATDMEELYDEENNFRQELVNQVLHQAVELAIREDGELVSRDVTLELVYQDGQWWVVPDRALLQAISGGLV